MARRNPYAQARPADWSSWTKAQRGSWNRRNYIAKVGDTPRSLEQRAATRRARGNPREVFDHYEIVKYYAKAKGRAERLKHEEKKSRAITARLPAYRKANPRRGSRSRRYLSKGGHRASFPGWFSMRKRHRTMTRHGRQANPRFAFKDMKDLMARRRGRPMAYPVRRSNPFTETEVRTVVREFKRKYGGQALGWAKDAASLQHRGSDAERMYSKVVVALRDGLYAHSNPRNDGSPTRGKRKTSHRGWGSFHTARPGSVEWSHLLKAAGGDEKEVRYFQKHGCWSWEDAHNSNPRNDGSPTRGEQHARRLKDYRRKHPHVPKVDRRAVEIEARMACVRDQLRATDDDAVAERLTAELTALAASKRSNPARRRRT